MVASLAWKRLAGRRADWTSLTTHSKWCRVLMSVALRLKKTRRISGPLSSSVLEDSAEQGSVEVYPVVEGSVEERSAKNLDRRPPFGAVGVPPERVMMKVISRELGVLTRKQK